MEKRTDMKNVGHIGVVHSATRLSRRNHLRRLTAEEKEQILETYKKGYEEYQRKLAEVEA